MIMEYNTTRSKLILREYGRNFHKLVDYVKNVKEKDKRSELSHTLIDMMKVTHPSFNDQSEVEAKLWDDLHIMSRMIAGKNEAAARPKARATTRIPLL